ncbi:MAG: hypothetical protein Q7J31_16385 [Syntrophales bacterium]|nr:hypothetical protein [Syntrophales bacterium]
MPHSWGASLKRARQIGQLPHASNSSPHPLSTNVISHALASPTFSRMDIPVELFRRARRLRQREGLLVEFEHRLAGLVDIEPTDETKKSFLIEKQRRRDTFWETTKFCRCWLNMITLRTLIRYCFLTGEV